MTNESIGDFSHYLNGIRVVPDSNLPEFTPTLQLSLKIDVTAKFRKQQDAWLLKMFGRTRTMYEVKLNGDHYYRAHPNTIRCIEINLDKNK